MSEDGNNRLHARALRLAVIKNLLGSGHITEADAKELLNGPLTPGDDSTIVDDSELLHISLEEFMSMFWKGQR